MYNPLTELAGHIAQFSVSEIPAFFGASSNLNSVCFSEWSGQAG